MKFFDTEGTLEHFRLHQRREGTYQTPYAHVKVYLVGFPAFVHRCTVDGEEQPIKEIRLRDRSLYTLTIAPDFTIIEWHV